jgi:hypothetical protein
VLPEHVQMVFASIAAHRLEGPQGDPAASGNELADALIKAVPGPI